IALFGLIAKLIPVAEPSVGVLQVMMILGIQINLGLLMFNLLPIPPLDGSHVMKYLLPPAWSLQYQRVGFLGLVVLLVVLNSAPGFINWWFTPANFVSTRLMFLVRELLAPSSLRWLS